MEKVIYNPTYQDCLSLGWRNGNKNIVLGQAEHSNEVDVWCFSPDDFGGLKPPYTFIVSVPDFPEKQQCIDHR
jgi:hypothetical protein